MLFKTKIKMKVIRGIIAGLLLIAPVVLMATPDSVSVRSVPELKVELIPDTIMIGDRFVLRLTVSKDATQRVAFPDGKLTPNDTLECLSVSPTYLVERNGRDMVLGRDYTMMCFASGKFDMGRFSVLYGDKNILDTIYSDAGRAVLVVNGFDIDTAKMTIADISPVRQTPFNFDEFLYYLTSAPVLLSLFGVAVIVAAAVLLRRWWRKRKPADEEKDNEPAHSRAIRELEVLAQDKLWQNGHIKEYYTRLSDVVRSYIARRYGFAALEMTTPEVLDGLRECSVGERECKRVDELLGLSDLVKFAKYVPEIERHNEAYNEAYIFVEETKEQQMSDEQKTTI